MVLLIPEKQGNILRKLGPQMRTMGFYLAGGTALAIYYQHRVSVDIDWFTPDPMGDALLLGKKLQEMVSMVVTDTGPGTLHALVDQVRLSFLEYRYPLLAPIVFSDEYNCPVASLDDIACMKMSAIAQRGARKDFIDLYALVQRHRSIAGFLELFQKKYGIENVAPVLYGLIYFDDAENEPLPEGWQGDWDELVLSFRDWVREID